MNLRPYSSWIILVASVAVVAGISALSTLSSSTEPPLSAQSAQPDGALALSLWLKHLGYDVQTAGSMDLTGSRPGGTTLTILQPQSDLTSNEAATMLSWVESGGRVVIATDGTYDTSLPEQLGLQVVPASAADVVVSQPLLLAPPVSGVAGRTSTVLSGIPPAGVALDSASGPVLAAVARGRGTIWILTAPRLLDNAEIAASGNRELALNLAGAPGGRVVFLQRAGGLPSTGFGWFTSTVWGVAVLFGLAVLVLYRWLSGWRLGPPLPGSAQQRRPATEYVVSLAGLLQRVRGRGTVVGIYQRSLRRAIRERWGDDEPAREWPRYAEVERLLSAPDRLSESSLVERVARIVECEEELRATHV